jgi:hypothetical protein
VLACLNHGRGVGEGAWNQGRRLNAVFFPFINKNRQKWKNIFVLVVFLVVWNKTWKEVYQDMFEVWVKFIKKSYFWIRL